MNTLFQFTFSDGTSLELVPHTVLCEVEIDGTLLKLDAAAGTFTMEPNGKALPSVPSLVSMTKRLIDVSKIQVETNIVIQSDRKVCSADPCNGKYFCVTGGCGNIGCGWLCDQH